MPMYWALCVKDRYGDIAERGYQIIINLALSTSDNAIPTEGDIITSLGMFYIHIPIQWKNPTFSQFQQFATIMQQQSNQKVWVHCALNMRVSVFLYLYNTLYLNVPEKIAIQKLNQVWQPNEVWLQFIDNIKNAYNK